MNLNITNPLPFSKPHITPLLLLLLICLSLTTQAQDSYISWHCSLEKDNLEKGTIDRFVQTIRPPLVTAQSYFDDRNRGLLNSVRLGINYRNFDDTYEGPSFLIGYTGGIARYHDTLRFDASDTTNAILYNRYRFSSTNHNLAIEAGYMSDDGLFYFHFASNLLLRVGRINFIARDTAGDIHTNQFCLPKSPNSCTFEGVYRAFLPVWDAGFNMGVQKNRFIFFAKCAYPVWFPTNGLLFHNGKATNGQFEYLPQNANNYDPNTGTVSSGQRLRMHNLHNIRFSIGVEILN